MSARPPHDDGPCDLLVTSARIVDVQTGTVRAGSIAVTDGWITALAERPAREVVDLRGRAVAPGFIDAHVHIESAMASVAEFARAVVARGTTAVVADPHEIANVLGAAGLRYMLEAAQGLPVRVFYTLPSCVPATDLETSGARLAAADLEPFFADPAVVGLGEVMNYPGVLAGDADLLAKIAAARRVGKPVDGHAPGLTGRDLAAYVAAGVTSDHECTTATEAREKLAAGMHVMIREGTAARNLAALLPVVDTRAAARLMWCTDDRQPRDLLERGHIDSIVAAAVRAGVDPVTAIRMATLSPAERFGLHDRGAIAPGRRADFVVIPDLSAPTVEAVYVGGRRAAANGRTAPDPNPPAAPPVPPSMHAALDRVNLEVRIDGPRVRVIEIVPGQIVTRAAIERPPGIGGRLVSDAGRDLLKIAVIERHTGSGRAGVGLVRGLGLQRGAIAMSIAHDSHNIIAAGVADEDLRAAAAAVAAAGGGIAAAAGGRLLERLPLPIAGLMSPRPVEEVAAGLARLVRTVHDLGSPLPDPFMTLAFLALPVIPELKLTDRGLVDVTRFEHVPLFD